MKGKIRLIASDLDGTLLTTDKQITDRTREALVRAIEAGVTFLVATGRPYNAIPEELLAIPGLRYVMASNGALVYDLMLEKPVYRRCISEQSVSVIWERLSSYSIWKEVCVDGIAYVEQAAFDHVSDYLPKGASTDYLKTTRKPVPSLDSFLKSHIDHIEKINLFFDRDSYREELMSRMADLSDLAVTTATWNNVEYSDRHATKGEALTAIAGILAIPIEETIAFGDNLNDLSMILAAGTGVAMGNGHEELIEKADLVTKSNDEDGVSEVILQFL